MSQQNSATPRDFLRALEHKFNVKITFDLACTTQDCVVEPYELSKPVSGYYFDLGYDALKEDWSRIDIPVQRDDRESVGWLNPPWKKTGQFVKKCSENMCWLSNIRIFSLFPAGVGTNWFRNYVHGIADVYFLSPRMTYIDPRTGEPFIKMVMKDDGQLHPYRDKCGKTVPQTGLNDAILCDWGGSGETYCWNWKETLAKMAKDVVE